MSVHQQATEAVDTDPIREKPSCLDREELLKCVTDSGIDSTEILHPSEIQLLSEEGMFSTEVGFLGLELCVRSGHLEVTDNERKISFMSDCSPLTVRIRYSQSTFEWREQYVNGRWRTVEYVQTHTSEQAVIDQHEVILLAMISDLQVRTVNSSEADSSCVHEIIEDRSEETSTVEPVDECINFWL